MSATTRAALIVLCGLAMGLAGCGGSSSVNLAPTPSGSFTNTNLKGAYAFEASGSYSSGVLFSVAGTLQADGNGNITSGTEDIISANSSGVEEPIASVAITASTYTVGADGRGVATLNSGAGSIGLDFVLLSSGQRGLVIRFDNGASASGTLDRQDSTAFAPSALTGQFAFNLSGVDANGFPLSSVGTFATDGGSALTGGVQDFNDIARGPALNSAFTGTYAVASNGRGTATFNTPSTGAQQTFAFYVVNATHVKMIEIDSSLQGLAGDAFAQQSSFSNATVSGPFAFSTSGATSSSSVSSSGPYAAAGLFTADGNGNITSGVEGINSSGSVTKNAAVSGSYTLASNGRGTLTLSGTAGVSNYVFYPTASFGLQMMGIETSPVASGTAFVQQAGPYSNSSLQANYGFNASGDNSTGEVDTVALITGNGSGRFTGSADVNFAEALFRQLAFNGSYSVASNGRGTASLTNSASGTQNFTFYMVSPSQVLLVETDTGFVSAGTMLQQ